MAAIERALVIGGGIGGLSTAIALRRVGVEVDVLEKNPKWDVYGVGIIQPPNAIRALDALGLADKCVAAGHAMLGGRTHLLDGTVIGQDDYPPADPRFPPMNGLTRPALHAILQDAVLGAEAHVRTGVTVADLVQRADGVSVTTSGGATSDYDLVVVADGLYSETRSVLFPDAPRPRYTGQACFRYNLPRLEGLDRIHVFIGQQHGTAGLVPLSKDLMYVLFIKKWAQEDLRVPTERLAEVLREQLAPFGGEIAQVRDQITDPAGVVYRPVENVLVPRPWYRGRVVLIGDAAHGTSPHAGQGAAQAIEDAVVLAEEVERGGAAEEALERFMDRRFERCSKVVELSGAIGEWEQAPDPNVNPNEIRNELMAICAVPV